MQLTFNVDSDGVVYDWHGFMIPFLSERLGKEMTRDTFKVWDLAAALDVSKTEFDRHFDQAVYHGAFYFGRPVPGAIQGINSLVDAGHRVRIVTNKILPGSQKAGRAMRDTVLWYADQGLADRVEFVFTGSKYGKSGYPANVVIDDKPDLAWMQATAVNIIFDQPWNQKVQIPEEVDPMGVYLYRASGWGDVLELAEQMGGGLLRDKSPVVV